LNILPGNGYRRREKSRCRFGFVCNLADLLLVCREARIPLYEVSMPSFRASQALLLLCTLAITPAFGSRTHRAPTSGHSRVTSSKKGKRKEVSRIHGQRAIDSSRASEIQTALIHQKYLSGAPSGQWDAQTQVAMRQYQSDHGWQTKLTPDSRALISLGLGPSHSPAVSGASAVVPEGLTTQAQSAEPEANTLASVHSLSQ
jgi:putative peptidoglycan binding protein